MNPPIFYAPPEACNEKTILLPADESRHAVRVLRLKKSAPVVVIDGLGAAYRGEVLKVGTGRTQVEILVHSTVRNYGEPEIRLTLAAGLSAAGKFDTVVQKGTELGVKRFVPIITEKSKVRLDEPKRAAARVKRLEKVALAAAKQCRRAYRPEIAVPTELSGFLGQTDSDSLNLLFHPGGEARSLDSLDAAALPRRATILVGPEAGFSELEARQAVEAGFTPVSLGRRVLRAETAGPVACALVMFLLDDLR